MTDREAFEAWVIRDGGYLNDADDEAKAARLIAASAWQAATAAALERAAVEVDRVEKETWCKNQSEFGIACRSAIRALKESKE